MAEVVTVIARRKLARGWALEVRERRNGEHPPVHALYLVTPNGAASVAVVNDLLLWVRRLTLPNVAATYDAHFWLAPMKSTLEASLTRDALVDVARLLGLWAETGPGEHRVEALAGGISHIVPACQLYDALQRVCVETDWQDWRELELTQRYWLPGTLELGGAGVTLERKLFSDEQRAEIERIVDARTR